MYRCEACNGLSLPGQTMSRHVIYRDVPAPIEGNPRRTRKVVFRELGVCSVCRELLARGVTLESIVRKNQPMALPRRPSARHMDTGTPVVPVDVSNR